MGKEILREEIPPQLDSPPVKQSSTVTSPMTSPMTSPSSQLPATQVVICSDPTQIGLSRRVTSLLAAEGFNTLNLGDLPINLEPKERRRLVEDVIQARVLVPVLCEGFILSDICMEQLSIAVENGKSVLPIVGSGMNVEDATREMAEMQMKCPDIVLKVNK